MNSASREKLFSAIVSSRILAPYLANDPELAALLESPNHCNVHYPRTYAYANQLAPALREMLEYMLSQKIYSNLEATKQLVGFSERHPDSQIYDITFNCERQSYGVCCGLTEEQLSVICVLTGGHIPDDFFGETIS